MSGTRTGAVAAPWWGRTFERQHALFAMAGSLTICLAYAGAARFFVPESAPGPLEFAGTFASLWGVWITQRRNVLAMPIGILSVALMGTFFWQVGLVGQALLHWAYYVPIQMWGWQQWTRGGADGGELIVTRLRTSQRLAAAAAIVGFTLLFGWLLTVGWDQAVFTYWDASIVAASVVAQLLMSRKKVESWWLWIVPIDISGIALYTLSGATMFAALYTLFLAMALVGLIRWVRAESAATP